MKRLLWTLLIQVVAHNTHAVNVLIAESPFVEVLLKYVAGTADAEISSQANQITDDETFDHPNLNLDGLPNPLSMATRRGLSVSDVLFPTQVAELQLLAMTVLVKVRTAEHQQHWLLV